MAENVGAALEGRSWVGVLFAGGMSELWHIKARTLLVNDKHDHVMNLASVVADPVLGAKLIRRLRRVPVHVNVLAASQAMCRSRGVFDPLGPDEDRLEWAYRYFISAWMSRNGKAGTKDEFSTGMSIRYDGGGGDSAVRFYSAVESLVEWRIILKRCTFICKDVFDMLKSCKDLEECGLYADPPFWGPGDAYLHTFTELHHRRLAKELAGFEKTRVVIRYYDAPLIRELYPEDLWEWHYLTGRKQTHTLTDEEVLLVSRPR